LRTSPRKKRDLEKGEENLESSPKRSKPDTPVIALAEDSTKKTLSVNEVLGKAKNMNTITLPSSFQGYTLQAALLQWGYHQFAKHLCLGPFKNDGKENTSMRSQLKIVLEEVTTIQGALTSVNFLKAKEPSVEDTVRHDAWKQQRETGATSLVKLYMDFIKSDYLSVASEQEINDFNKVIEKDKDYPKSTVSSLHAFRTKRLKMKKMKDKQ
jgi:hypothetical protein